jgi:phosphate transport system permease protein
MTTVDSTRPVADPSAERPAVRARVAVADLVQVACCAVAAIAAVWLGYEQLTGASGALGFWLCTYVVFVGLVYVVARAQDGSLVAGDRIATIVVCTGAGLLLVPLVLVIGFVVVKGLPALRPALFTQDMSTAAAGSSLSVGGALHSLIGTLEQVGIAVLISVPLGVMTAVFLVELSTPLHRPVRLFVDALSGVPSIVAGLFVYAVLIQGLHQSFSGFAAALALSVLMLPTVTRTAEEVLRLVPSGLREASLALGAPQWRTVWSVVLPSARSGLVTSVVLGVARAVGETAPLILTAFGNSVLNANPFSGAQDALPLYVYTYIRLPSQALNDRAYAAALVLVVLVLVLFTLARLLGAPTRRRGRLVRRFLPRKPR